jgi:hypothetical protein
MSRTLRVAAPSERFYGAERVRQPSRFYVPVDRAL